MVLTDTANIVLGIVTAAMGAVASAFVVGTVAWVLKKYDEAIKNNAEKSEQGDAAVRNELKQAVSEQHQLRKDDRETLNKAIDRLDSADEQRRQDIRNLYEKNLSLIESLHESEKKMLLSEISRLKEEFNRTSK